MTTKIDKKIISSTVLSDEADKEQPDPVKQGELTNRPGTLTGMTYKIKPPEHVFPHAIYVTLNDFEGRPFEVFINSKDMSQFQWVVALTRVISAVFRKGGNVEFLVAELTSVYDPTGGWWEKGVYRKSVVAAIGDVIGQHLYQLGYFRDEVDEETKRHIKLKLEKLEESGEKSSMLERAISCYRCGGRMVPLDGCLTCLDCGNSKCG